MKVAVAGVGAPRIAPSGSNSSRRPRNGCGRIPVAMWTRIDPGPHKLVSKAPEADATLEITAEAGKNLFVWQEVKFGMFGARTALSQVDEESGKRRVLTCELVQGY